MRLKSYVRNKAQPEGTIAEGYIKEEYLTFCARYFEGVETFMNRPLRNDDIIPTKEIYMLNSGGRKLGKVEIVKLDGTLFAPAHRYLTDIIELEYFLEHKVVLFRCDWVDMRHSRGIKKDKFIEAVDCVVAPTPGFAITIPETATEFSIKGNHLTLVKRNQFDGRIKTDPHKHIHEFLGICDMFKYRDTKNEVVRLMMLPLSLTGEAKTWLDELNEGTIETWDELQSAFISRFFPPALFEDHSPKNQTLLST
ncbi:reverse transcriptase domain-containing protein [Tanacetum coccineum]